MHVSVKRLNDKLERIEREIFNRLPLEDEACIDAVCFCTWAAYVSTVPEIVALRCPNSLSMVVREAVNACQGLSAEETHMRLKVQP